MEEKFDHIDNKADFTQGNKSCQSNITPIILSLLFNYLTQIRLEVSGHYLTWR